MPRRQYYFRVDACSAPSAEHSDCICWHDEGTGPLADARVFSPSLWRAQPEPSDHINMSTTNLPDQGNRHFTLPPQPRPPRTEPTYPPEPTESALPKIGGPSPFRAAERQPPKVVLTAAEAAERMKSLKERQTEDPVLKRLVAEHRDCIDDLVRENEALKQRVAEISAHLQDLTTTFLRLREHMRPPLTAALPPKKIAAKKKPKP